MFAFDLFSCSFLPFFFAPPPLTLPAIGDASWPEMSPSMLSLVGGDGCERRVKLRCGNGGGCVVAIDAERVLSDTNSGDVKRDVSLSGFFRPPRLSDDRERGKLARNAGFRLDVDDVAVTFNRFDGKFGA